ncbi:MAG TPA: cation:proton antiporter [Nocardioides sp.]|uniref:cation:proton antiporter domain-containing protein n=1 Tax=Nocardioides sp. TaxID=35761 RepID=UPI002D80D0A4|nr:cation:proton antiporter [Nocardioides sp.]HET6654549.1 cation:proton antiporter [Nocardioides sp.]
MDALSISVVLATIVLFGAFAARVGAVFLTAPIVFVTAGFVYAEVLGILELEAEVEPVKLLAEVTLVWLLFADASAVDLRRLRADLGTQVRLLGVALPMTVALGTVVAVTLLSVEPWAALLLGAALAPTDAALGAAVMADPRVPERTRRTLNIESGLNDGIVTPVVLLAVAGLASANGLGNAESPGGAVASLVVGVLVGSVVGAGGGSLMRTAGRRGWLLTDLAGPAVLALALLSYSTALVVEGNGFVAAFVGGLLFGREAGSGGAREVAYVEETASLASLIAWLLFGALAVPTLAEHVGWRELVFALLSLTVVRMLPVALALLGSGTARGEVAFIGWFGPRGLASVIFALLALETLHDVVVELVATIALTVVLSVLLHGLSAGPLSARFAESAAAQPGGSAARRTRVRRGTPGPGRH